MHDTQQFQKALEQRDKMLSFKLNVHTVSEVQRTRVMTTVMLYYIAVVLSK